MQIETRLTKSAYIKMALLIGTHSWSFYLMLAFLVLFLVFSLLTSNWFPPILYLVFVIFAYSVQLLHATFSPKNRNFFLLRRYDFEHEQVLIESPILKEVLKWDALVKWKKVAQYYLVYVSDNSFFPIPKSAIPNENIAEFEALLKAKIKK